MDLHLNNKSVIVTAASDGLGLATAKGFAQEGANVMIASRDEDKLQAAQADIRAEVEGANVNYQVCDMTKADDIKGLIATTVEQYGGVDVLINNSGGPPAGRFEEFSDEDWEYAFQLNLLSFVRTTRQALPHMKKSGAARIINIASSSFKQPIDHLILSNVFRTGMIGLSKSLSQELGEDNILVNTIGPGRIGTDRVKKLDHLRASELDVSDDDIRSQQEQAIPLGRYGTPEEFARVITFLGSGANTYVTGQAFVVDGGQVKAL
ncbi:SDR family oxidoreductase [Tuberibacillus sp. Marseille-P3662]|uniref:SDR family oxidoreductase n=1 Tax=Tuberibacillus sp. Marseille-P3662 TaxID=1965358 RepID=UPI000A1C82BB|nr:SDR family oxidoreductase [Tuberibacillus sp. Marseille-P3662]